MRASVHSLLIAGVVGLTASCKSGRENVNRYDAQLYGRARNSRPHGPNRMLPQLTAICGGAFVLDSVQGANQCP